MPDITMCISADCTKKAECHRNELSGTQYSMRQSVSDFTPEKPVDGGK